MDIILKTEKIIESNLSINDYLYLNYLYLKSKNEDATDLLDIISSFDDDHLQSRGYLKITESGNVLRSKAIELFESKELFYRFLSIFPIKTPSGRYLSPAGTEGIAVQNLKKKWIKLFKNKPAHLFIGFMGKLLEQLNRKTESILQENEQTEVAK